MELFPFFALFRGLYELAQYSALASGTVRRRQHPPVNACKPSVLVNKQVSCLSQCANTGYQQHGGRAQTGHGLSFSSLHDGHNGMATAMVIMAAEWPVLLTLSWYFGQVLPSGVRTRLTPSCFAVPVSSHGKASKHCRRPQASSSQTPLLVSVPDVYMRLQSPVYVSIPCSSWTAACRGVTVRGGKSRMPAVCQRRTPDLCWSIPPLLRPICRVMHWCPAQTSCWVDSVSHQAAGSQVGLL